MTGPVNKDYYRLASYATGAQINHNPFGVQELQSQLLFAGGTMALPIAFKAGKAALWTAPQWAYKNFGNYTSAWQELMAKNKASKDAILYMGTLILSKKSTAVKSKGVENSGMPISSA